MASGLPIENAALSGQLAQLLGDELESLAQPCGLALEIVPNKIIVGEDSCDVVPFHGLVDAQDNQHLLGFADRVAEAADLRLHLGAGWTSVDVRARSAMSKTPACSIEMLCSGRRALAVAQRTMALCVMRCAQACKLHRHLKLRQAAPQIARIPPRHQRSTQACDEDAEGLRAVALECLCGDCTLVTFIPGAVELLLLIRGRAVIRA
jgi:hypothetical protein